MFVVYAIFIFASLDMIYFLTRKILCEISLIHVKDEAARLDNMVSRVTFLYFPRQLCDNSDGLIISLLVATG